MKHSSAVVLVSSFAGLAAAQNGWWFGRDRPRCADDCYRSFRNEARPTAYCTDSDLASSVGSCLSSACASSTEAIESFESRTSSVCSVYSGCSNGATQTLTITRGAGRDRDGDDDDDDDDRREPRTTTATVTGCPGDGRGWGWAGNGWGWGWDGLDRDGDGDLDRDDWRDWCRGWGDGYRCRTRATTVTVTMTPGPSASASLSTRVATIIQAVSGDVTQGTTVDAAAPENTGGSDSEDDDEEGGNGRSAGASVNVQFAGLALGLFVAVAGLL